MLAVLLAALAAIVVEDQTALRATAQQNSPRQVELWKGDWLEVRGERAGYVQVYDHRRERPGYVRAWQVRIYALDEATAPGLRAVLGFLRDQPGSESLGIGYAALYLRAAPRGSSEVFDGIGVMADRLARRASSRRAGPKDATLAAHLAVAQSYGITFANVERNGRALLCYDGEAFRRVLATSAIPLERATAALALTRLDCVSGTASPADTRQWNEWRLDILARVEVTRLPAHLASRLHLRHAEVLAWTSYDLAGRGVHDAAASQAEESVRQLALVDKRQLPEEDLATYDETAVRVAASRFASEKPTQPPRRANLRVDLAKGEPGETCLRLTSSTSKFERCTFGHVWPTSIRIAPTGAALTVAVQLLPSWTELWLFRQTPQGWQVDTLTPAISAPDIGYVESAGFSPDGAHLLLAREAIVDGSLKRSFEVRRTATLALEKQSRSTTNFPSFTRWAAPDWHSRTLALR